MLLAEMSSLLAITASHRIHVTRLFALFGHMTFLAAVSATFATSSGAVL